MPITYCPDIPTRISGAAYVKGIDEIGKHE
jgi:hypothetical protein